jgi:hypothetical protein
VIILEGAMETLIIEAGHSVGDIKLGMSKEEVQQCLRSYEAKCNKPPGSFSKYFRAEYDSAGKLEFIEIASVSSRYFNCLFHGIDVFKTRASTLVAKIDEISPYVRDADASRGFAYTFPKLGLSLWRGHVLNDDDLEEEWFKQLDPNIQEDERRNLYFESVGIKYIE